MWIVLPRPLQQATVEFQHRYLQGRQTLSQARLYQHGHRGTVFEQVADAVQRVRRVNRHIRRAGLEDRHQPHQGFQTAARADRHAIVRLHPQFKQLQGQLIGLLVQFTIGQRLPVVQHRDRLRVTQHLLFDTLMDGQPARVVDLGLVETFEQLRTLGAWQHRQLVDRYR
ncbi:hypothetical protein [Pseudomonas sp. 58 R 3]|nr:hypothetical protein [Pseudomonas sp. 58 R 3]